MSKLKQRHDNSAPLSIGIPVSKFNASMGSYGSVFSQENEQGVS